MSANLSHLDRFYNMKFRVGKEKQMWKFLRECIPHWTEAEIEFYGLISTQSGYHRVSLEKIRAVEKKRNAPMENKQFRLVLDLDEEEMSEIIRGLSSTGHDLRIKRNSGTCTIGEEGEREAVIFKLRDQLYSLWRDMKRRIKLSA